MRNLRSLLSGSTRLLALTSMLVAFGILIVNERSVEAQALSQHRVMIGLNGQQSQLKVTQDFHGDKALDLSLTIGSGGATVSARSYHVSGPNGLNAFKDTYTSLNNCTGVAVVIKKNSGSQLGRTTYVHVAVSGGMPASWTMVASGWTAVSVGTVSTTQPLPCGNGASPCPSPPQAGKCTNWSGPHLHEGDSQGLTVPNTSYYQLYPPTTYSNTDPANWVHSWTYN